MVSVDGGRPCRVFCGVVCRVSDTVDRLSSGGRAVVCSGHRQDGHCRCDVDPGRRISLQWTIPNRLWTERTDGKRKCGGRRRGTDGVTHRGLVVDEGVERDDLRRTGSRRTIVWEVRVEETPRKEPRGAQRDPRNSGIDLDKGITASSDVSTSRLPGVMGRLIGSSPDRPRLTLQSRRHLLLRSPDAVGSRSPSHRLQVLRLWGAV